MALVGLDVPGNVQYPSLAPTLLDGAPVAPTPVFSEIDHGIWHYRLGDRYVMIRDGQWKLCLYRHPGDPGRFASSEDRVLYDLERDPEERHNLASDPAYVEVMDDLVAKIDAWDGSRPVMPSSLTARYQ
jgi:arylsulfatase A-like enzyme